MTPILEARGLMKRYGKTQALVFLSGAYVPVESMPNGVKQFAVLRFARR